MKNLVKQLIIFVSTVVVLTSCSNSTLERFNLSTFLNYSIELRNFSILWFLPAFLLSIDHDEMKRGYSSSGETVFVPTGNKIKGSPEFGLFWLIHWPFIGLYFFYFLQQNTIPFLTEYKNINFFLYYFVVPICILIISIVLQGLLTAILKENLVMTLYTILWSIPVVNLIGWILYYVINFSLQFISYIFSWFFAK
ncbi:MAG: hypothetical protein V7K53_28345 [Nostoc sp.]|uniref:hypothetical protein n=1 Tax=Nostoc sp. TaxID=1180 RepID=UPI002FF5AA2A